MLVFMRYAWRITVKRKIVEVEIADLLAQNLREQGVDVDEIRRVSQRNSAERGRKLAEQLAHSVLTLFIKDDQGRPDRIGTCVLARVDAKVYAFTAGHVVKQAGSSRLLASPGPKGNLLPLPYAAAYCSPAGVPGPDLDVGILCLEESSLGAFGNCCFLIGHEIDEKDEPDGDGILEFYYVFGYPASRTQVKVSHAHRQINQRSFQLTTSTPGAAAYVQEHISPSDFVLVEFDHNSTVVEGKIVAPPKLQGLSGGAILRFNRHTLEGRLVAIATEHRRSARYIVGTRIKHFLGILASEGSQ